MLAGLCPEDPFLYCQSPREVETSLGGHTLGYPNKSISVVLMGNYGKAMSGSFLKREH